MFEEYIDVTFENCSFKAIKDYDIYLRNYYGNYMELPPVEKRIAHHSLKHIRNNEYKGNFSKTRRLESY